MLMQGLKGTSGLRTYFLLCGFTILNNPARVQFLSRFAPRQWVMCSWGRLSGVFRACAHSTLTPRSV